MDSQLFVRQLEEKVGDFCRSLDPKPPAYSYVPLTSDEMRIKVMKSRLFNEVRAGEIFGVWIKTTPEMDVRRMLATAVHEEYKHATFLEEALQKKGADPYDYRALPAQMAMFNGFEALNETVERIAAFPMAGEGVADYLIQMALKTQAVPDWIREPYRKIHQDEETHGNYPAEMLVRYATTEEKQDKANRAVAMSLMLRRHYFDNLDQWVFEGKAW